MLTSPYIPGPSSYYRRMNESLEKENKLLRELNTLHETQLAKINGILKRSETNKGDN